MSDQLSYLLVIAICAVHAIQAEGLLSGRVYAWGGNTAGQTGPLPAATSSGVIAVAGGASHSLALLSAGDVVGFGSNAKGQTTIPAAVQGNVAAISAAGDHSLLLLKDGSVRVLGDFTQASIPNAAQANVTAIAAGKQNCLTLSNGKVFSWGTTPGNVPMEAQSGVQKIAAGDAHSLALLNNGTVIAWGANDQLQLEIPLLAQTSVIIDIAAGSSHSLALTADGNLLSWGGYTWGLQQVPILAKSGIQSIAAGGFQSMAITQAGKLITWGWVPTTSIPLEVKQGPVITMAAGLGHLLAVVQDNGTAPPVGFPAPPPVNTVASLPPPPAPVHNTPPPVQAPPPPNPTPITFAPPPLKHPPPAPEQATPPPGQASPPPNPVPAAVPPPIPSSFPPRPAEMPPIPEPTSSPPAPPSPRQKTPPPMPSLNNSPPPSQNGRPPSPPTPRHSLPPPPPQSSLILIPTPDTTGAAQGSATSTKSNTAVIGGGIAGGAAALAALVGLAFWWKRRPGAGHQLSLLHNASKLPAGMLAASPYPKYDKSDSELGSLTQTSSQPISAANNQLPSPTLVKMMFPSPQASGLPAAASAAAIGAAAASEQPVDVTAVMQMRVIDNLRQNGSAIKLGKVLGSGGFGTVYLGKWAGNDVAVKVLDKSKLTDEARAALHQELLMMCEVRHPCIVQAYGLVDDGEFHAIIMHYYKRGPVSQFMRTMAYEELTLGQRLRMGLQVASGMCSLHQTRPSPILHGDLKTSNLLLGDDGRSVLIADFGLARRGSQASSGLSSALTVAISPPEVLQDTTAPRTTAVDVYAFGIVLLELLQGRPVYTGMRQNEVISTVLAGNRPVIPPGIPRDVVSIMTACWAQSPSDRPTFPDVFQMLEKSVELHAPGEAMQTTTMSMTSKYL